MFKFAFMAGYLSKNKAAPTANSPATSAPNIKDPTPPTKSQPTSTSTMQPKVGLTPTISKLSLKAGDKSLQPQPDLHMNKKS